MTEIIITCSTPRDYEAVFEAIIRGAAARRLKTDKLDRLPEKLKEVDKH
jgi:hypothetical protein